MSTAFSADTIGLRHSVEEMRRLPGMARTLVTDFLDREGRYTEWPGWTDDYALKVRPAYERDNQRCVDFGDALHDALDALVSATLANLDAIEKARNDSLDTIADHSWRTAGASGDDGESGRR
ncbi:hypothetical protein CUT44_07820 [Streptomyces carminius]|uniref:Uncharacterized protein n=1 Tax=Streptomyces carminius TaxID=2665496 RepID=A0A2M8M280_9ACTN|nr:hypothetical protein [Streptomyces carminius]PJE98305.1 hypothetical protein CUT44_07820 [Streptomyces carminius]